MTNNQKKRITLLRQQGTGYARIASELKLSVSTVKTFCRRNRLMSSDLANDTQPERISETTPIVDLISAEKRGNSTDNRRGRLGTAGHSDDQPVCEVTIKYADTDDIAAVADVLTLLTNAHYGEVT